MTLQSKADRLEGRAVADQCDILCTAEVRASTTTPVKHLKRELGPGPFALVALFVTPTIDFQEVVAVEEAVMQSSMLVLRLDLTLRMLDQMLC